MSFSTIESFRAHQKARGSTPEGHLKGAAPDSDLLRLDRTDLASFPRDQQRGIAAKALEFLCEHPHDKGAWKAVREICGASGSVISQAEMLNAAGYAHARSKGYMPCQFGAEAFSKVLRLVADRDSEKAG